MITLEQYADLCAAMADTGGDESKEIAIAAAQGVDAATWRAAKQGYTAKMSDPNDMGRTAMAFMPLYQAAQQRLRGGKEPCTIELYAKVKAQMAFRKGPDGQQINYHLVLAEHGYHHQSWIECEGYWTPRVATDTDPKFDAAQAATFRALVQKESDVIFGIVR